MEPLTRMSAQDQIAKGLLVCPETHGKLQPEKEWLVTEDGARRYPLKEGVPMLLADRSETESYLNESPAMVTEYEEKRQVRPSRWRAFRASLEHRMSQDFRTEDSVRAYERVFTDLTSDQLWLSIGGGPLRMHPGFVNVNVGPFLNVDVVGDAHQLPYRDEAADAIYCEAVLEHLSAPHRAVKEMARVLKPGGRVYAATPFLQPYHGYPSHFQNFTLSGHRLLFETNGFEIEESGTCVGPVVALWDQVSHFVRNYAPSPVKDKAVLAWRLLGLAVRPLDRHFNRRPQAHTLASTTYVVARKKARAYFGADCCG